MKTIHLVTFINASRSICFDLSRSIDLHLKSMQHTNEHAIGGRKMGLIGLNESVTWKARHFGIYFKMTVRVSRMEHPNSFTDEMIKGPFNLLRHQHIFNSEKKGTLMSDIFQFESPFGILGATVDFLFLKPYLKKLLLQRNQLIKEIAEKNPG